MSRGCAADAAAFVAADAAAADCSQAKRSAGALRRAAGSCAGIGSPYV